MVLVRCRVAALAALVALASISFGVATPGGAESPSSPNIVKAIEWLETQQQPDGGFDALFPGFETPDAVLAIAEAAQTSSTWSTAEANAAVTALVNGAGKTPIDGLDDWVKGGINAGQASKVVALVTKPLGLDASDFGPSHTDLAKIIFPTGCANGPTTSGVFFDELIFLTFAGVQLCGAADPGVIATIRAGQRADGGWNFEGNPSDATDSDVDTTTFALDGLVAGGATWADAAVKDGLKFLAAHQDANGAFQGFSGDDPNSTATAIFAIVAAGFDPGSSCWRDSARPELTGTPYTDPRVWLRSVQDATTGEFVGPVQDTFATTQSVEALLLSWWPIARATGAPECAPVVTPPTTTPSTTTPSPTAAPTADAADAVAVTPRFTG